MPKTALKSESEKLSEISEQEKAALKDEMEKLKAALQQLIAERDRYKKEADKLEFAKQRSVLEYKVRGLEEDKTKLSLSLKAAEKRMASLEMSELKHMNKGKELAALLEDLQAKCQELTDKNKLLQIELERQPQKIIDLAKQNQDLIKDTGSMHYNLGVFYVNKKEFVRAIKEYQKALELQPADSDSCYNLGYLYAEHLVDREKAMDYFKRFLHLAPDDKRAEWVRNYLATWEAWSGEKPMK